jgi:DNA-directed RNA polymerase subunit beta
VRRSFARLNKTLDVPNLIDIQRRSFEWLTDPQTGGLRETIDDISPIEDYTGNLAVQFGEFVFDDPVATIAECREKDLTYARPLTVRSPSRTARRARSASSPCSWATSVDDRVGHLHHQRHRARRGDAAGALAGATSWSPRTARSRSSWPTSCRPALVARAGDRQEGQGLCPHRPQAQAAGQRLLRAMARCCASRAWLPAGPAPTRTSSACSRTSLYIRNTGEADTEVTSPRRLAHRALQEAAPGRAALGDAAKNLLNQLFFDPKRYDLTRVGRYKLNARLGLDIDLDTRVLTHDDIHALVRELVTLPKLSASPRTARSRSGLRRGGRLPAPRARRDHLDEYEHFGNRRLRTVGELIQEAFRIGLYRMERVVRERLTTEDEDTITPQTIVNIRPSSPRRRSSSAPRSSRSSWTRRTRWPA